MPGAVPKMIDCVSGYMPKCVGEICDCVALVYSIWFYIPLILTVLLIYLILDYISHYEHVSFGGLIPSWLCVFCLKDFISEKLSLIKQSKKKGI